MIRAALLAALLGLAVTSPVAAEAPSLSPRPMARPAAGAAFEAPIAALVESLATPRAASALAVLLSPRPMARPRGLGARVAVPAALPVPAGPAGSVCGVAAIRGERIPDIDGPGRCGVEGAVRVSAVSGIPLSMQPTIDCTTAKALNAWVRDGIIPAVGNKGGGLAQVTIIAHYACRSRNNQPGARLSEHGLGHAVDVAGIVLRDGTRLTVAEHWRSARYGKLIKAMHRSACGPFGTVLGPDADRYHQDHIHVDTARYRGGPYCH